MESLICSVLICILDIFGKDNTKNIGDQIIIDKLLLLELFNFKWQDVVLFSAILPTQTENHSL